MSKKKNNDGPVPVPPALPLPVVDNHTHLDHVRGTDVGEVAQFEAVEALITQAVSVNVTRMVQIGCDLPAARWTVQAVDRFPQLLGGVALHPTEATKHAAAGDFTTAFDEIEKLAEHPRVRVVGETGLDHYWVDDEAGRAAQEESFRRHIDLAKRLGKALQIHDRDAHDDVIRVLESEGAPEKTVFHCFSGDAAMARLAADRGWYLSFAGTVTFKNAADLREALAAVPLEQVMVETDAPYLTPMPHRGRPNASYLVPLTVRFMAETLGRDLDEMCATLSATSETVYGQW
ncbi:TatD family hydrolase [Kineosporia rhizophila]|uniref:TatD family hydrolase n=1 Tax=Kineosporia TaxID=49184 RepID=UPI000A722889|nr:MULTISPECIES: TatD family hydrolase [Kineosporia]MCE0535102.1 TatD family hydrolase [Kineosporia rhizophila]GLY14611.1 hydrolase TatD [Kineosporia sp. NBRC 101677]